MNDSMQSAKKSSGIPANRRTSADAPGPVGADHSSGSAIEPATLDVVRGDATPRSVPVAVGPVRMGRATANQLVLADGGVSRTHAEIRYEDGAYVIRDLGSSNGTCVDGVRVVTTRLRAGASIEMGGVVLQFSQRTPEVPDAERIVLMGRSDLLRALELPTLAAAAKVMTVRSVPKDGVLLRQSTPMEGIIFVHRGALRVVEESTTREASAWWPGSRPAGISGNARW